MATLRPETENRREPHLISSNESRDKPEEGEVKSQAGEAAESDSGLCAKKAEVKELKQCCDETAQTGSSSPLRTSFTSATEKHELNTSAGLQPGDVPKPGDVSPLHSESELVLSETEGDWDVGRPVKPFKENTGDELQAKAGNQAKEDIKHDLKHSVSKDDVNEETLCNDENKDHEEEKEEDSLAEEEGEPGGGEKGKEEFEGEDRGGGGEEEEEEFNETETGMKRKKSRLECHECGKKFTRRETYNLHRHFHMHQDEQASLTCKECGLTFQHRSSLIKHRSEHRQIKTPPPAPVSHKRSSQKEFRVERSIECDHCGDRFSSLIAYKLHACRQRTEKPYRCPLCRREFQYRVSINAHMQSHSLDSPYRCLECNKGFQCALTLHIHQRSHAALKPYECPDCGMVFRHRSYMEDHRRKHTEEKPHQCKMCDKSFKYSSLLQQHQYLHTGQKPYRCPECGKRFAFAQNMRAHCRQHKKKIDSASPEPHFTSYDVTNGTDVEIYGKENTNHDIQQQRNCPLCPQLFSNAADLREHMLIHEMEYEKINNGSQVDQTFACPYCPLKFFDESSLQSHALSHQVVQASLRREVLSVARAESADNMSGGGEWVDQMERKSLRCKDCGKCFRYRSVLELHMRIHTKGYQCHICKKSFRFSSYLQQHLIIHSGKKPFKCPDCGKDFAFLQNMKTHQRLHQQKPFRCTQCRKGYSEESQLQRHMLCHSGDKPHKCHLCDKSFGLAYLLRDHLNTHTGERPHRCQECHKSFPWLSSLLVHQKIHVRKRQGLNQSSSSLGVSQRGRTRGVGGRGRRTSRWGSEWPRVGDAMGRTGLQQVSFSGQVLQGVTLTNIVGQPQPVFDADMRQQARLRTQSLQSWPTESQVRPVQLQQQQWQIQIQPPLQPQLQPKWLYEGQPSDTQQHWHQGSYYKPILPKLEGVPKLTNQQQQQKSPGCSAVVLSTQTGTAANQNTTEQDNSGMASETSDTARFTSTLSKAKNELEQKTNVQPTFRASSPSSTPKASHSADRLSSSSVQAHSPATSQSIIHDPIQNTKAEQSEKDNKTHGSLMQNKNEADKPAKSKHDPPQGQESKALPDSSESSKMEPAEKKNKPWNLRTPLERSRGKQEKAVNENETQQQQLALQPQPQMSLLQEQQEKQLQQQIQLLQQQNQLAPLWVSAPQPSQLGSVSIQLGAARFTPGNGSAVWGFQTTPVVSQALVNGPLQQGTVRAQPQSPVVSGPQILLNQTPPFISLPLPLPPPLALPGPHPIHSVTGQLAGAAPPSIFFTPQSLNERSVLPQALPSQLAQRTEPLGNQIPFAPDRRCQCMICGGTLPGELELQMHYMQHAQGEI